MRGNCYVTCEALYHLLGGRRSGYSPRVLRYRGATHWFLVHRPTGLIIDPAASQFKSKPPYHRSRGCGFLTKRPSKRARNMMRTLVWQ